MANKELASKELIIIFEELKHFSETVLTRLAETESEEITETNTEVKPPDKGDRTDAGTHETGKPDESNPDVDPATADKAKKYSPEDVRGVLANAAHNGHRDEVIKILKDHGAKNITELKEGDYAEVVAQAEALSHAG